MSRDWATLTLSELLGHSKNKKTEAKVEHLRRFDGRNFSVAPEFRLLLVEGHELGVDGHDVALPRHLVAAQGNDWNKRSSDH